MHPKSVFEFYQACVYEALGAEGFQRGGIAVISIGLSMQLGLQAIRRTHGGRN